MENLENNQTEVTTTEINTQEQEVSQKVEKELKTFTEEEVNKQLQSETDKVRTEYSKKNKSNGRRIKGIKTKRKDTGTNRIRE